MRKLVIVTKKFGGDFTGATLATQYFISKWKDEKLVSEIYLGKGIGTK